MLPFASVNCAWIVLVSADGVPPSTGKLYDASFWLVIVGRSESGPGSPGASCPWRPP